jgi:uncharacterized protein (AIM24 family)
VPAAACSAPAISTGTHLAVPAAESIACVHGYGNAFDARPGASEQIDVEPGGWVYKDRSVRMETQFQKFATGLFASAAQIVCNRFTGPGRVGIQSMYIHMPTAE